MGGIIHITKRRNLLYVIYLMTSYFLRQVDLIIIKANYTFNDSLLFTFLMLFCEFLGGLPIYIYQRYFLNKREIKKIKYLGIELIQETSTINRRDSILKMILLIFFTAYFDFVEFVIATFYMPKYTALSPTAETRFGGGIIIIGALICHFILKIKILKHQFYCLIIIGICLIIIIIPEIIVKSKNVPFSEFLVSHLLIFGYLAFVPMTDVVEKYLIEFNFLNPFFILTLESVFGFILISIYSAGENPFKDIKRIYGESSAGEFALLIFLLFLYFIFSAGVNIYKVLINGLFSPMVKTLSVYILNPIIFIYYFIIKYDFLYEGERNWLYFMTNIIISIVISFFGCVFNEFLVLSCFGLDHDTHFSVSRRATVDLKIKSNNLLDDLTDDTFEI